MVWTGRLVIAWGGGCCGGDEADGASYNPATNTWRVLPVSPLSGRRAAGVWTGKELVVVGGNDADGNIFTDGAAYNPTTRTWRSIPSMPAPRGGASIVWDGTEVLVVGGYRTWGVHPKLYASGLAYSPSSNRWRNLPPMEQARMGHVAVWTGHRMLVWGGETLVGGKFVAPPHGLAFDPGHRPVVGAPAVAAARAHLPPGRVDRHPDDRLGRMVDRERRPLVFGRCSLPAGLIPHRLPPPVRPAP